MSNQSPAKPVSSLVRGRIWSNTSVDDVVSVGVALPVLSELKTGEEGEEVIFFNRTKLIRFIDKEYNERRSGELKILRNLSTGKYRIIMRRDVVKTLCRNHYIISDMTVKIDAKSKKSCNWFTTADFSEGTTKPDSSDDVSIVSVSEPSEEQVGKA